MDKRTFCRALFATFVIILFAPFTRKTRGKNAPSPFPRKFVSRDVRTFEDLADVFEILESQDLRVDFVALAPKNLRALLDQPNAADFLDPLGDSRYKIWGAHLAVDPKLISSLVRVVTYPA